MSTTKKLTKITPNQIAEKGVQALSNRPNSFSQYGVGGLSAANLKLWFDKLATFLAEKINELQETISGDEAAEYIRIMLDDYGVENLDDLVKGFVDGSFANNVLKLYPSASSQVKSGLQSIINNIAARINANVEDIAELDSKKLNKIVSASAYRRAYIIMPDGTQATVLISEEESAGAIPLYNSDKQLCCAIPVLAKHAVNKGYADEQALLLGSQIDLSIDKTTYKIKAKLKNFNGEILSESSEIDLPLEQMIIKGGYNAATKKLSLTLRNNQEETDNNSIEIDISDLIDGLVSETRTINGKPLTGNIVLTAADVGAYKKTETYSMDEIDQKEIYAHAAFWSEESETARNYTRGGGIDKQFKDIVAGNGMTISLSMDDEYKLTISLKNRNGTVISSGMVDLPIESLITNASYSNKALTLTFQSGQTLNVSIADIVSGLVPETRKVNGKPLSGDITLLPSDIGAVADGDVYKKTETYNKTETDNKTNTACQTMKAEILGEHQSVGFAYNSVEAEKASGYTKGGQIDKAIKSINERLASLENKE